MADPSDTSAENAEPDVNPWLIALAVILPAFMEVIDTSIASVCIPYIAGSLSASNDEATWVLTFYLLSNAVVLPASSWFSLRFGRKRFLVTSIVIFTIASFFCGAANSLITILIARLVQGAGGGALQPLSQAILTESFPPEKRGLAMGMFGLGVVVAPVLGPTLGGWLTDQYSWRWAFYINIPIGALAIFLILRYIKDPSYIKNANPGKLDSIGFGLLAVGLGCLQIMLDRGQEDDWFGAMWIRWAFLIMVVCLGAFIFSQLTREKTLVDLSVFKNRNFAIANICIFVIGATLYGSMFLLPLYYQVARGQEAWVAGLLLAPQGIGAACVMRWAGSVTDRLGPRRVVPFGILLMAVATIPFAFVTTSTSEVLLALTLFARGIGLGLSMMPVTAAAYFDLNHAEIPKASTVMNIVRLVGGSVATALFAVVLERQIVSNLGALATKAGGSAGVRHGRYS